MATLPHSDDSLYLGIDGGGTKCSAVLVDANDTVLGVGEGGPANPYHGFDRALESIQNAADTALRNAGLSPADKANCVVGMGLAGVHLPTLFKKVEQWNHPFKKQYLTNDLHIACIAAHENDDGAVIVAGTGSCGFVHVKGQSLTLGAHGMPCGDKGSGAWLGLSAVQAVLLASDGLGPQTELSQLLFEQMQAKGMMIVDRLNGATSSDYARLAPLVIHAAEQGDAVACAIVQDGADYLSAMANKLISFQPPRISMLGGVSKVITAWMDKDVVSRLSPALKTAEYGAVHFAKSQLELSFA